MIAIPALHDAASDRPVRYTPVCSHTRIPVCLNPAYAGYLPATVGALAPVLTEVAGLPGAPVRISQAAATYRQGPGNSVGVGLAGPSTTGRPPVFRLLLLDQLPGPAMTTSALAAALRASAGPAIVAGVTGGGPGASPAQQAVTAALIMAAGGRRTGRRRASRRATGSGCPRLGQRPARRPMPRPGGSPRCRPPPGTPGWCGTWPRCGPAGSPWPSCHDRRRGAGATAAATGAGRPPPAGQPQAGLRLVRLHAASRRVPAALAAIAACAIGLRIALAWQLGHLRRAAAAAGVRGRAARRPSRSPPPARSGSRNASRAGGCRTCGWPPRWR